MFEHVVKFLHQKDKSILTGLAYSPKNNTELAVYVSDNESELRSALKIDDHVFVEKNTSTALKMSILRRIFALYEADPMDLVFYLKNDDAKKSSDASRYESRRRYWEYALPIIQKQHIHTYCQGDEHCKAAFGQILSVILIIFLHDSYFLSLQKITDAKFPATGLA